MERHPADSRELRPCGRPRTQTPVVAVRDVLVVPTSDYGSTDEWRSNPPAGDPPFALGRALFLVDRLGDGEDELVFNACTPRGHFFFGARQFGVRVAFVRHHDISVAQGAGSSQWDSDGTITVAYKLSRWVRDNAASTEFSARVVEHEDGEKQVIPGPVSGESAIAYRAREDRDWLDADDAGALRELLEAYWKDPTVVRDRLDRAQYRCEESAHHRFAEDAVAEVVGGLEALLKTHKHQSTRQFVGRVPLLARELELVGVTKRLCEQVYRWRSQSVHGAPVSMLAGREPESGPAGTARQRRALDKLALLQLVLRTSLRRSILEPSFGRVFRTPARVRRSWPVAGRDGKPLERYPGSGTRAKRPLAGSRRQR